MVAKRLDSESRNIANLLTYTLRVSGVCVTEVTFCYCGCGRVVHCHFNDGDLVGDDSLAVWNEEASVCLKGVNKHNGCVYLRSRLKSLSFDSSYSGNFFLWIYINLFVFIRVNAFSSNLTWPPSAGESPPPSPPPYEPGPAQGLFLLKGSFSINFQNWIGSVLFKSFCFQYLNVKSRDFSVKRTPCSPPWPCLTQILSSEPENTLGQERTNADTLCIDSVWLVFQVAMFRVSTNREEEGGTCPETDPEGEQLLMAQ